MVLDDEKLSQKEIRAIGIALAFGTGLTILGLGIWLAPSTLSPIAAAYQEACARNPYLLSWSNHIVPLLPSFATALAVMFLLPAGWTLWRQLSLAKKIASLVKENECYFPRKLTSAATSIGMLDRVTCVSDERLYAFCQGMRRPQIFVSTGLVFELSAEELAAVLLHESSHLANRDPLKLLCSRVIASGLLVLPVAGEWRERFHLAREVEADNTAIRGTSVSALANALLKVLSSNRLWPDLVQAPVGAMNVTRERIIRLADAESGRIPPIPRLSIVSSLFVALALFISIFGVAEAAAYWSTQGHECAPDRTVYRAAMAMNAGPIPCDHLGSYGNGPIRTQ